MAWLGYRGWFPQRVLSQAPQAKLFVLECGVSALLAPQSIKEMYDGSNDGLGQHGLDIGYHGGHGIPETPSSEFLSSLLGYEAELQADSYVLAGAVFGYGMNPDWDSHDIAGDAIIEDGLLRISQELIGSQTGLIGGTMGYRETYATLFDQWDSAGGVESNFKAFVAGQRAAQGQMITAAEYQAVLDRLHSAAKEYALVDAAPKA